MAQLDKFIFVDQSLLIFVFFFILYLFHSRVLLPYIATNLKSRKKILSHVLEENSIYSDLVNILFSINNIYNAFLIKNITYSLDLIGNISIYIKKKL